MPSASSAAPPSMAGMISHLPQRLTRLYRAKMPPSPWLSARSEMSTYLMVVSSVTVHTTRESAPSTNSSVTLPMPPLPATSALVTYIGLVPISPYTTPSVTSIAEMLTGIAACGAASLTFCSISRFPPNFNVRRDYRQSAHGCQTLFAQLDKHLCGLYATAAICNVTKGQQRNGPLATLVIYRASF